MIQNNENSSRNQDQIDFKELYDLILLKKKLVLFVTTTFTLCSIFFAYSLPNIFTSKVLLAPALQEDSLTSQLGNFSSLGSIAGISLPSSTATKNKEGIERIKSYEFFLNNFLPFIKLENIMATKKWDAQNNIIIYDKKLFDEKTKTWVRDVKYPKKVVPSSQEAYKAYREILSISEDQKTSFVSISIEHHSPEIAKRWLEIIVIQINETMRDIDASFAKNSIAYLNETSQSTNIQSIKETIGKLLENQMKALMLTASNEEYVFKILDSPIAPEEKSKPKRLLICVVGFLLGLIFSLILLFIHYLRKTN